MGVTREAPCNQLLQETSHNAHAEVHIPQMLGHIQGASNDVHPQKHSENRAVIGQRNPGAVALSTLQ
eukprot:7294136-Karenia_brevis.AAC.1